MSSPRDASTTNFLRALNQLGDTLLNSPDNIPWQVVAETLGSASRACRSYIFLLKNSYENKRTLTMVAEWCSEGVQPQIGAPDMDHFVLADHGFRRLEKVLSHGGWINDRVRDCPPSERAVFAAQDIQSILLLPIMVREEWIGLVGLDNTQDDSRWSESEVEFLRAGARMMASSYDRWREEKAARWRERNVMALRDAAQALLRETDEVPWQRFVDILGPAARSDRVYVFLNQEDLEALRGWLSPLAHVARGRRYHRRAGAQLPGERAHGPRTARREISADRSLARRARLHRLHRL